MSSTTDISKKFINNIRKLDSKNHLMHGEIYAFDGSIYDFEIDSNIITSKVRGAPGDLFDVEIIFNEFTNNDKKILTEFIQNNPVVYSKFLNNEIDEELMDYKVNIFPSSLKDFKMNCSCGKGLFCKHKAAVFHKLSYEMKNNPFLIFTIHGFDLNDVVGNRVEIKKIRDILKNDEEIIFEEMEGVKYIDRLYLLLSDYPSFYASNTVNFKDIVYETLSSMSNRIYQIMKPYNKNEFHEYIVLGNTLRTFEYFTSKSPKQIQKAFENKWLNPQEWNNFKIDLNGNYDIVRISTGCDNNFLNPNLKFPLFAFFAESLQVDTTLYNDKVQFLKEVFTFTARLIYLNALIPEFFKLDNNEYHIRWIPVFNRDIYDKINELAGRCPDDLVTFYDSSLSKKNQIINLVSLFFEGFCKYYMNKFLPASLEVYKNETFFRLFFVKSQDLKTFCSEGTDVEIDNWISVLYLKQKDFKLIINTDQKDYNFYLNFKILHDDKLYDLNDLSSDLKLDVVKNLYSIHNIFNKSYFDYDLNNPRGLSLREYSEFFDNIAPVLEEIGVKVNVPLEFGEVAKAKLILNIKQKDKNASLTLDDLANFDWKIAIGDETFSVDEFETFVYNFKGLVKVKDKYYMISEEDLEKLKVSIDNIPKNPDKSTLIRYILGKESQYVEMDVQLKNLVEKILKVKDIDLPENLNGTLRPYQKTGVSWLLQNMQVGFGSILADDMGLGKTIQLLTAILYLKENNKLKDKKALVIAPTSILTNWAKEIEKFTPTLKVETYHGLNRTFPENDYDILLTSYGIVRQDLDLFKSQSWYLIVVDEAQNIKNPKSKQTKAVKSIKADHHIAMSGTPIENHLSEYWSLFDFANKGYLNSLKTFKQKFIKPIENEKNMEKLEDFRKITSPFILRRLKTDKEIIKDLPDKMVNDIYCNLTLAQAKLYEETLNSLLNDVEESEGIKRKGLVLKLINALKQICNHPSQYIDNDNPEITESGKMEVLINTLDNIIESDEKVLIFTQYVQMGKIMKKLIEEKFDEEVLFLHGGVKRNKRDEMVDKFQNGKPKIFILSLKAGGTGLNLTAASNVIHYDLWWNPAVENQATDRAYRIGQKDNVMVYRFITTGTLEESINQILLDKRELVDMTIGSEESFITEMTNDELRDMLYLRSSSVND